MLIGMIFSTTLLYGQGKGSTYSIFGIGELKPLVSVQNAGMGFTSIGVSNPYYINLVNPAANANAANFFSHRFEMGLFLNNTSLKTADGGSEKVKDGGISQLSYWFRINKRWTALLGLSNYSNVGYSVVDNSVLVSNNSEFTVVYNGSGGLNQTYFSNSILITKSLSVGARFAFIFGNIIKSENVIPSQSSNAFVVENSINVRKVNVDFGLNYLIKKDDYEVNVGAIYDNGTELPGTIQATVSSASNVKLIEESEFTRDYSLPQKFGIGVSFRNQKITVAADIESAKWSEASVGVGQSLNDTWRASMGVEYVPDYQSTSFLKRINYRAGAYRQNHYLNVNNTSFDQWGITAGFGIQMRNASSMNFAYHKKFNGTRKNGLIYESTNEFTFSVAIKERWFVQNKYN